VTYRIEAKIASLFNGITEITNKDAKKKLREHWLANCGLHGCSSRSHRTNTDHVMPLLGFSRESVDTGKPSHNYFVLWRREA
jgi:hypothetical protein